MACGCSVAKTAGSNTSGGTWMSLLCVVCCQVEASATDRSLVQTFHTECDLETSTRWPRPNRAIPFITDGIT